MSDQPRKTPPGVEIMQVRSRFQKQASREGGVSKLEAIAKGQQAVEELADEYLSELSEDIRALDALVASIAKAGTDERKAILDGVYVRAKRLRDLGKTFGYHLVTEVADLLCELVYRKQNDGTLVAHEIETCALAVKLVGARDFQGTKSEQASSLLDGLRKVVNKHKPVAN